MSDQFIYAVEGDLPNFPFDLGMDLTGLTVTARIRKPSGSLLDVSTQIDDVAAGTGSFTINEALPVGRLPCELAITETGYQVTLPSSASFTLVVRSKV